MESIVLFLAFAEKSGSCSKNLLRGGTMLSGKLVHTPRINDASKQPLITKKQTYPIYDSLNFRAPRVMIGLLLLKVMKMKLVYLEHNWPTL